MIVFCGQQMTIREACRIMNLDYENFMEWCHKHALQSYGYALNFYKRTVKHAKNKPSK